MANVILRKGESGELIFYLAKKDLEEVVVALEHDSAEKWGGELTLSDGSRYYLEPQGRPNLPKTVRANRLSED